MSVALDAFARAEDVIDRIHGEQVLITPMVTKPLVAVDANRSVKTLVGLVDESEGTDMAGSGRGPQANRADMAMGGMKVSFQNKRFPTAADRPRDDDTAQLLDRPGQPVYVVAGPGVPDGVTRLAFRLVRQP